MSELKSLVRTKVEPFAPFRAGPIIQYSVKPSFPEWPESKGVSEAEWGGIGKSLFEVRPENNWKNLFGGDNKKIPFLSDYDHGAIKFGEKFEGGGFSAPTFVSTTDIDANSNTKDTLSYMGATVYLSQRKCSGDVESFSYTIPDTKGRRTTSIQSIAVWDENRDGMPDIRIHFQYQTASGAMGIGAVVLYNQFLKSSIDSIFPPCSQPIPSLIDPDKPDITLIGTFQAPLGLEYNNNSGLLDPSPMFIMGLSENVEAHKMSFRIEL